MKKNNLIISGTAALVALTAVGGMAFSSFAASNSVVTDGSTTGSTRGLFAGKQLSDEDRAAFELKMEERRSEMDAKRTAVKAALDAGDYNAWVAAEGEDNPILEKINTDNFARFVEAHKLMDEARIIMEELGIEKGLGGERGMGKGLHLNR